MVKTIYVLLLVLSSLLLVGSLGPAYGDQVFHSTRLNFVLTAAGTAAGFPALTVGQVVDIHPGGPVNGAIETYMIGGAEPNTSYQVVLRIFNQCGGNFLMTISTVTLVTDNQGFGQGKFVYTEASLAGFEGLTAGVLWTLVSGSVTPYDTQCISVSIG